MTFRSHRVDEIFLFSMFELIIKPMTIALILRKHKIVILMSIFFFYLGSLFTISFVRITCVDTTLPIVRENDKVEYAVLILSSPSNEVQRNSIRVTWMKLASNIFIENGEKLYKWKLNDGAIIPNFIKFYFVVGIKNLNKNKLSQLNVENDHFKDLLLLNNLEDSYKNLASKVLQTFTWFSTNLPQMKYVIKCDDDSFVRVDLIVKDLEAFASNMCAPQLSEYVSCKELVPTSKGLYWGYMNGRAHVRLTGKWQEQDWFLCDNYLPYALGGGYVISKSIVDYIARNIDILSRYQSEDVSMGVWTAALHIDRVHDSRFDTAWKSRGCTNNMLVRHKQTSSDMLAMYKRLSQSQGTRLCAPDDLEGKFYKYKWNVLPSMCCR